MRFKIVAAGLALAFSAGAQAQAQDGVTLYGVIDTGIQYANNIGATKSSSVYFPTLTSSWPSYWGLRGREKLADNLSAVFNLEAGFAPGTGESQQGRLFGRQAWVGLKGDWGQVAFGDQYNMLFWALAKPSNVMGPNAHGFGTLDSYTPNARMNNSVTYRGKWAGFDFGLAYARGRDTVNGGPAVLGGNPGASNCGVNYASNTDCRAYSALLAYDSASWGFSTAYDVITGSDSPSFTPNFYRLGSGEKDRRIVVSGYARLDVVTVGLTYMNRKSEGAIGVGQGLGDRSDLWSLGASWRLTPAVTLDGSVSYMRYGNATESSRSMFYVARAKYALSKRTSTYVSVGYMQNKGNANLAAAGGAVNTNPAPGQSQTSVMVGLRHDF